MRIHLIADVGGHLDVFSAALKQAGVDVESRNIPEDTCVIQVSDLVHKEPESDACVSLADDLLGTGRYVQLWGNHEVTATNPAAAPVADT